MFHNFLCFNLKKPFVVAQIEIYLSCVSYVSYLFLPKLSKLGSCFSTKRFIVFTCMQSPVSISTQLPRCRGAFLYFFCERLYQTTFSEDSCAIPFFENSLYCLLFLQIVVLDNFFANWSTIALCLQILLLFLLFLQFVVLDTFFANIPFHRYDCKLPYQMISLQVVVQ